MGHSWPSLHLEASEGVPKVTQFPGKGLSWGFLALSRPPAFCKLG